MNKRSINLYCAIYCLWLWHFYTEVPCSNLHLVTNCCYQHKTARCLVDRVHSCGRPLKFVTGKHGPIDIDIMLCRLVQKVWSLKHDSLLLHSCQNSENLLLTDKFGRCLDLCPWRSTMWYQTRRLAKQTRAERCFGVKILIVMIWFFINWRCKPKE